MITSYMAIHQDETDEAASAFERARAALVQRVARRHGVPTTERPDGDTTYVEARVSLLDPCAIIAGDNDPPDGDDAGWQAYVEFLMDLEDSNLGYLLHEVETEAEHGLMRTLTDNGDDSCSLGRVDIEFRVGHRTGQSG